MNISCYLGLQGSGGNLQCDNTVWDGWLHGGPNAVEPFKQREEIRSIQL